MKTFQFVFMFCLCLGFINLNGQINLTGKLKNQTNNRANNETDKGINKGLDNVENGVKGLFKKKKPADQAKVDSTKAKTPTTKDAVKPASDAAPSLAAYSKYDFIPGEKVIFYEDFSQDAIGDFPALWNTNGSAEVVTTNLFPGHWMKFVTDESIWTDALLQLPDNYTIEFDIIPIKGTEGNGMAGFDFRMIQAKNIKAFDYGATPGVGGLCFTVEYYGKQRYSTWFNKTEECGSVKIDGSVPDESIKQTINQKYHIAFWVQKSRLRCYQDQNKLFDLPKALPVECIKIDRIRFEDGAGMVSNIRIAVGAPDMRNKLMTDGKLVTYGIYFDVNKDVVKPESYGTLKGIADILNEVPDVKVKIVGHTDSDGADAANLDLSKRRAAAVKAELVKTFNVNGDRLVTDGMGKTQPVAPNDTPCNKALNRRVEFIKL